MSVRPGPRVRRAALSSRKPLMARLNAWLQRHRVLELAGGFYALLLGPGLLGLLLDRLAGTLPGASLAGVLVGVFCATVYLVKAMAGRYEALAPAVPAETEGSEGDQVEV